jgi:tetratricopeptide (TPR) repeat protein
MKHSKAFASGICVFLSFASVPAIAESVAETSPLTAASQLVAPPDLRDEQLTSKGFGLIRAGKAKKAISEFDQVIAASDRRHFGDTRKRFCARDAQDAQRIVKDARAAGSEPVLIASTVCDAHFGKGFALIDLGRGDLAEAELRRASELAPFDAHYANEYAELFKSRRDWDTSLTLFTHAWNIVDKDPAGPDAGLAARALRGIAYNEMMLGNLDEAERNFHRSLEFEPGNKAASIELGYIARKKAIGS